MSDINFQSKQTTGAVMLPDRAARVLADIVVAHQKRSRAYVARPA